MYMHKDTMRGSELIQVLRAELTALHLDLSASYTCLELSQASLIHSLTYGMCGIMRDNEDFGQRQRLRHIPGKEMLLCWDLNVPPSR